MPISVNITSWNSQLYMEVIETPEIEEYIKKKKAGTNSLEEVMEKRKTQKLQELEEVQIEAAIAEAKKKIEVSGGNLQTGQSSNFVTMLLHGRKPEEVKQIIDSLDETALDKLAYLAAAMNGQQLGAFTQTLRKPETNVKETIELINTIVKMSQKPQEQQGITLQGIAALMKEMREAQPQQPQTDIYDKFVKPALDEIKAMREESAKEQMLRLEKEIAGLKNRPSLAQELAMKTEEYQAFQKIFGNPSGESELTLKKEEMRQTHDVEMAKLDWEKDKWAEEKESNKEIYGIIRETIKGPVSDLTKSLGGAAAERIRGGHGQPSPQIQTITCPSCNKPFNVVAGSPQVVCPSCNAVLGLGLQQQLPPQQTQSPQTQEPTPPTEAPHPVAEQPEQAQRQPEQ